MPHVYDFHTHSNASHDGQLEVKDLVKDAVKAGVRSMALTDHNTVTNIDECIKEGKKKGIEVISGIELSAHIDGKEVHIVGLNINHNARILHEHLDLMSRLQVERNLEMIRRLNEAGINISYDLVKATVKHSEIQTQDIAKVLSRQGYAKTAKEAYESFLAKDKEAFVGKYIPAAKEITDLIRKCDGISILAHDKSILEANNKRNIKINMEKIKGEGIDGLEVYFNHNGSKFVTETVLKTADELGMLVSGGSDYHGFENCKTRLGVANNLKIGYELLENMKKSDKWKQRRK